MILLVVDTQKGCFTEALYSFETVRNNIKKLITVARENNVEVVYVQHDDGPGSDLAKGTDNYEIYEDFAPRKDERRFEKVQRAANEYICNIKVLEVRRQRELQEVLEMKEKLAEKLGRY